MSVKSSIQSKIQAGFGAALTLLLFSGAIAWWSAQRNLNAFHAVDHTYQVLHRLQDVLVDSLNSETGMRGFVLTGKSQFLEPYEAGLEAIPKSIAELQRLTLDNPNQQHRLAALNPIITS